MKNVLFLLVAAFMFMFVSASAQSRTTPQERLQNLKEKLNLTEDQSAKVEQILIKSDQEIHKLRASQNPDREGFRKIRDNSNQEIMKVLDDEQKTEFNKLLDERKSHFQRNSDKKN